MARFALCFVRVWVVFPLRDETHQRFFLFFLFFRAGEKEKKKKENTKTPLKRGIAIISPVVKANAVYKFIRVFR